MQSVVFQHGRRCVSQVRLGRVQRQGLNCTQRPDRGPSGKPAVRCTCQEEVSGGQAPPRPATTLEGSTAGD